MSWDNRDFDQSEEETSGKESWPHEHKACVAYASMINSLELCHFEPCLEAETVYESQKVITPLVGRDAILGYLRPKLETFRQLDEATKPRAELAQLREYEPGRPCVILHQGGSGVALAFCSMKAHKLSRVDLTIIPGAESAGGSGGFPNGAQA